MASQQKRIIYWDVDDVVLNTSETIIQLINDDFRIPNNIKDKSIKDLKDWKMQSIYRPLPKNYIYDIIEDDRFWSTVRFNNGFIKLISSPEARYFQHYFVTIGSEANLKKKNEVLCKNLQYVMSLNDDYEFIGLLPNSEKHIVNMEGEIQIDDNLKNLVNTNAGLKILLKNNLETDYNTYSKFKPIDNLYEVNTLQEVYEIITFILNNPGVIL